MYVRGLDNELKRWDGLGDDAWRSVCVTYQFNRLAVRLHLYIPGIAYDVLRLCQEAIDLKREKDKALDGHKFKEFPVLSTKGADLHDRASIK